MTETEETYKIARDFADKYEMYFHDLRKDSLVDILANGLPIKELIVFRNLYENLKPRSDRDSEEIQKLIPVAMAARKYVDGSSGASLLELLELQQSIEAYRNWVAESRNCPCGYEWLNL